MYCSYCERRIPTNLAVEHIQPKGLAQFAHLETEWNSFLLGCVNCNSSKSDKNVQLDNFYLPDRDNTSVPFRYENDGRVLPAQGLSADQTAIAQAIIDLVGLNKNFDDDPDLMIAALERFGQRTAAQEIASQAVEDLRQNNTEQMRRTIAVLAAATGFFSIWMKNFQNNAEMRLEFVGGFPGTCRECFDPVTTNPVSPRNPAPPDLDHGGKI